MEKDDDRSLGPRLPRSPGDLAGWRPLVRDGPEPAWKNALSRAAMAVLAAGCLWVAWQLGGVAWSVAEAMPEARSDRGRGHPGALILTLAGGLAVAGLGFGLAAVVPGRWRVRALSLVWGS